jgi:predicted XRE-type DNA-binding protein
MNSAVDYIVQNLSQGYSVESIKNQLSQSGLSQTQINQAFEVAYHTNAAQGASPSSKSKSTLFIWLMLLGLVVIVGVSLTVVISSLNPYQPDYDDLPDNSDLFDESYSSNDNIDKQYVIDDISQNASKNQKDDSPNSDTIRDSVSVVNKQDDLSDAWVLTNAGSQKTDTNPTITNSIAIRNELDKQVQELLQTDPIGASNLCTSYPIEYAVNDCYFTISIVAKNPEICEKISSVVLADKCYIELARRQYADMSICNKITDELKQQYCADVYSYQS